ncbi:MAG: hypothetical protein ACOC2K_01455 [Bacteroidota bacterium]
MKKIIIIMLFVAGFAAYAQNGHNPTVESGSAELKTKCIAPFTVENDQANSPAPDELPDVILGQTWTGNQLYAMFYLTKARFNSVQLHLAFDENPVDGVRIDGKWAMTTNFPYFTDIENNDFIWGQPFFAQGWIGFWVREIDATNAANPGVRTFTCSISGQYINL